ncbi:MAG: hypothetical protein GX620_08835 [Chloroflexi bacterium]|nr:hypothetical protein [Chloroflexota bacterium]
MGGLHADELIGDTDGLTMVSRATVSNLLEAKIYRTIREVAAGEIVVADSGKIDVVGVATITPVDKIGTLVTDSDVPPAFVAEMREVSGWSRSSSQVPAEEADVWNVWRWCTGHALARSRNTCALTLRSGLRLQVCWSAGQ